MFWDVCCLPQGGHCVETGWVLAVKLDLEGKWPQPDWRVNDVARRKARGPARPERRSMEVRCSLGTWSVQRGRHDVQLVVLGSTHM